MWYFPQTHRVVSYYIHEGFLVTCLCLLFVLSICVSCQVFIPTKKNFKRNFLTFYHFSFSSQAYLLQSRCNGAAAELFLCPAGQLSSLAVLSLGMEESSSVEGQTASIKGKICRGEDTL